MKTNKKLFITFFLIYVYFVHWVGWSENSRFDLTRAIVEERRFEIDAYHNDTSDRAFYNGHYYSDKAPGVSFIASPIYAASRFLYYRITPKILVDYLESRTQTDEYDVRYVGVGHIGKGVPIYTRVSPGFFMLTSMILVTAFTSPLFTSLTVVLVYCITAYFTKKESHRLAVALLYGLATLAFPNALVFMDSPAGTFFVFLGFYLIYRAKKENSNLYLIASGLSLGFAVVCEYPTLLVSLIILLYATFTLGFSKTSKILLSLLVGTSPLLLYNYVILGSPFKLTLQYNDPNIWGMATESELRYYGFTPSANPPIMLRLTLFPYRGLFFYHPILLLSLIGLFYMFRKNKAEAAVIILIFLSFIIMYSNRRLWHGGTTFGIRYMLPTIPFLMIPLTYAFKKINYWVVLTLVLISTSINIIGIQQPEDTILDAETLYISENYKEKQKTLGILYNPLVDHHLPLFLRQGPRSRIFEQALGLIVNIDIRDSSRSVGVRTPFLSLMPPILFFFLMWFRETAYPLVEKLGSSIFKH